MDIRRKEKKREEKRVTTIKTIMLMNTCPTDHNAEQKYDSDKQCSQNQWFLWNTNGAFSTSHSIRRALPAMSLNSAPGAGERIKVAAIPKSASLSDERRKGSVYVQTRLPDFGHS